MSRTRRTPASAPLIHEDFLLDCQEVSTLYHGYAANLPIIDVHSHLPPEAIAKDKSWENISQVWLDGDDYKWRAMRTSGVPEALCTGQAADREKFDAFAATLPYALRNPLYHWSHLELARYFEIDDRLLAPDTADEIWERTGAVLAEELSVGDLLGKSHVELVCTTDDPADSLEHHATIAGDPNSETTVLPAWRPDACLAFEDVAAFNRYLDSLGDAAGVPAATFRICETPCSRATTFSTKGAAALSDRGILPKEFEMVGALVADVCYHNPATFFGFPTRTK